MNPVELFTLDNLIKKYNTDELGISYAHGLMTSLLCSPDPIMPSTAYPFIVGDGENMAEFESEEEMDETFKLLIGLNNEIAQELHEKCLSALLTIEEQESYSPDDAAEWCWGFIDGTLLWPNNIMEDGSEEELMMFVPITMLSDPEAFFEGASESEDEIEQALQDCTDNLHKFASVIYHNYHGEDDEEQGEAGPKKTKVGRNDQCPCGSGKKYKKCCGA